MKKLIILIAALGYFTTGLVAQEEAVFGHYIFNPALINPAASGFTPDKHDVFINIRSAYTNFPETPKTYSLSYNGAIGSRLGLGAMLYTENIASLNRYRAQLSYAFRFNIKETLKMSLGLSTEWHRMTLNNNLSSSPYINDYLNDNLYEEAMDGVTDFDATLGLYGSYKDIFFFGISSPGLIRGELDRISGESDSGPFQFVTVNLGGNFQINESTKLMPSVLLKQVRNVDFQADINMVASFLNEQLITGLSYRAGTGGNFGVILGTKYSALRFIYTYDVYMGDFQSYNSGTHEITINFEFGGASNDGY